MKPFDLYNMQEPSYLNNIILVSIRIRMILTHIGNLGIHTKYQCLTSLSISILMREFLDTIIDAYY